MHRRISLALVVNLLVLSLIALSLSASTAAFPTYFTDNMKVAGPSQAPTVMEEALLAHINGAQTTIAAAYYDFNRVSIRDALIAAHKRGIDVRVVADDEARFEIESYIPHFEALVAAGVPIVDDKREHSIMHNKYWVFDKRHVWTGSTNMSDNGFTKNHNNTVEFDSADMAALYLADFEQMWAGNFSVNKHPSAVTGVTVDGIPIEIYFSPKDDAMAQVIAEVNAAQSSIEFAIFFLTDDGLRDALIAAKYRGVAVRGLWDSLGAANAYSDDEALCAAGIPIKIEDTVGKMHNKFMVIDAGHGLPKTVTGSMNWSSSGDRKNDENTLIMHDPFVAQKYAEDFAKMWAVLGPSTRCNLALDHQVFLPLMRNSNSTPPSADVGIVTILYNPPGDDLDREHAELHNAGGSPQMMTGWTLTDEAGNTFAFPDFTLQAGARVNVWVKAGDNTSTDLFWGQKRPVWNNGGDSAALSDQDGSVVDLCTYEGGDERTDCAHLLRNMGAAR